MYAWSSVRPASPIGMAAGFDKNAEVAGPILRLGFGFTEVGTLTPRPQAGNKRPRVFRLQRDRALINRLGFNNEGFDAAAARLENRPAGVIGVNIGANRDSSDRVADYVAGVERFAASADYLTINVSSPNTPELRKLQEPARLRELICGLQDLNTHKRPLFVKIAPDLSFEELDSLLETCLDEGVAGVIATNTTFSREGLHTRIDEQGGLSGEPLSERACTVISYISDHTQGELPIIGVGGMKA